MTTPSPTASPTLPANWAPTSSGCLRTDDYWIWEFDAGNKDARTVLGGPSQTTNCFTSTWDPTVTYVGSGCPPQYTSACHDDKFGAVTCCPSAYDFTCQPETWTAGIHAEWFRCISKHATQDVVTVTRTDFKQNTIAVGTRTRHKYEHLFALALMYTTPVCRSQMIRCNKQVLIRNSLPQALRQPHPCRLPHQIHLQRVHHHPGYHLEPLLGSVWERRRQLFFSLC